MGGDSKKSGGENKANDAQARIAQELFKQTDPLRSGLINRSSDFISSGANVMETPTYAAYKDSADRVFNQAKDNTIARLPTGGALTEALAGLEGQRASNLTQGAGAIYGDELARALSLGTGMTGNSLNSLGNAAAVQAQMAANQAQTTAAKYDSFGQAAGMAAGGK